MTNNAQDTPNETKKNDTIKKILKIVGAVALIILILLLLKHCSGQGTPVAEATPSKGPGFAIDSNVKEGDLVQRSQEEIQAELNEKVEQGMIRVSMATTPVFEDGQSEGNLLIVNKDTNRYPQIVVIELQDEDHTEIYRSGAIPVGSRVETAKLNVDLDAGEYPCVARFFNVDVENGLYLGEADALITIVVLN